MEITSIKELTLLEDLHNNSNNLYLPEMIKIIDAELRYNAMHYGRATATLPTYSTYIKKTIKKEINVYPSVWVNELKTYYGFIGLDVKWLFSGCHDNGTLVISSGTIVDASYSDEKTNYLRWHIAEDEISSVD